MKFQPFPNKPLPNKKILLEQHHFWDVMHQIELPFVVFAQKIFRVELTIKFWDMISKLGGSKYISWTPLILFVIGLTDEAKLIARSLVFFSILSSIGKIISKRRRPGSYPEVYARSDCSACSSFPSRHTIGIVIITHPLPYRWLLISFMILDRFVTGIHYPSDCLFGVFLGFLSIECAKFIDDPNLLIFLLLVGVKIWCSGGKVLAGCLPFLIVPNTKIQPYCIPLIAMRYVFEEFFRDENTEKKSLKDTLQLLLSSCLTVFLITKTNELVMKLGGN